MLSQHELHKSIHATEQFFSSSDKSFIHLVVVSFFLKTSDKNKISDHNFSDTDVQRQTYIERGRGSMHRKHSLQWQYCLCKRYVSTLSLPHPTHNQTNSLKGLRRARCDSIRLRIKPIKLTGGAVEYDRPLAQNLCRSGFQKVKMSILSRQRERQRQWRPNLM